MKTILIDDRCRFVPRIVLNRPEKNNALSIEMMQELHKTLEDYASKDKVKAIILIGAGEHFCSGLDLKEATTDDSIDKSSITLRNLYHLLSTYPKLAIAAVQGNTMAGGIGLAKLCDLVICAKNAKFQFPEVHRGLVPAYLLTILRGRFPCSLLRSMSLFSYPISGIEAFNKGLVDFLVEEEEMQTKLEEVIDWVCKGASGAQFHTKKLLGDLLEPRLKDDLIFSEGIHRKARESDEAREGVAAFFEKRPPSWCK